MQTLNDILQQFQLSKLRVFKPSTLFDPSYKDLETALSRKLCIFCSHKLYRNRAGDKWFCKSKKTRCRFMVLDSTLKKYGIQK